MSQSTESAIDSENPSGERFVAFLNQVYYAVKCALYFTGRVNTIVPLQLLLQIGSQGEVAARWYQFGRAVGTDKQMLEDCANYPPKEAIVKIFVWWVRNRQVTWKNVSEVLNNVGLQELAIGILKDGKRT